MICIYIAVFYCYLLHSNKAILNVFTHVASIYANLLEQKKAFA